MKQVGGHREVDYQDVIALSLLDTSMDLVVLCDVLEHLPDPAPALQEFARMLRDTGLLVATFPFNDLETSLVRTSIVGGRVVHHLPTQYHGDSISGGVLCFL